MNFASKRARIFRDVLKYIENDDWEERDNFLIFGSDAYYTEILGPEEGSSQSDYDAFLLRIVSLIRSASGTKEILKRISLQPSKISFADNDLGEYFQRLSAVDKSRLRAAIAEMAESAKQTQNPDPQGPASPIDDIDAKLALDAIDFLENSFRRLSTLDEINVSRHKFDGAEYFEEAHQSGATRIPAEVS